MCTTQAIQPTASTQSTPSPAVVDNIAYLNNNAVNMNAGQEQMNLGTGSRQETDVSERRHRRRRHHRHHHSGTPKPSREHVMNQVDKILGSVASGNIVGIVDESLKIRSSESTRTLVTGIMNTIFHPVDRLFGRGGNRPSQAHGISGNAT